MDGFDSALWDYRLRANAPRRGKRCVKPFNMAHGETRATPKAKALYRNPKLQSPNPKQELRLAQSLCLYRMLCLSIAMSIVCYVYIAMSLNRYVYRMLCLSRSSSATAMFFKARAIISMVGGNLPTPTSNTSPPTHTHTCNTHPPSHPPRAVKDLRTQPTHPTASPTRSLTHPPRSASPSRP